MTVESAWYRAGPLRIHCLCGGRSGEVLLMLHGGSSDSAALSWHHTLEELSASYRILAPDLPGYGRSDRPGRHYDLAFYTGFLEDFVQDLGLSSFNLLGFSLGGQVALNFGLRSPARVRRLILVSSAGLGISSQWPVLGSLAARLPSLHRKVRKGAAAGRKAVRLALRSLLYDPRAVTPDLVEAVAEELGRPGAGRAWRSYLQREIHWRGFRSDLSGRLPEVQIPTLLIHGREDPLIALRWAERAHRLLPGSRLCILPECGHWPSREKPREFNRAVLEFLSTPAG